MSTTKKNAFKTTASALAIAAFANLSTTAAAQDATSDEIIVTGIRQALESAIIEKRQSNNLQEIIQAEDIGKLPDQNLAEVLENITGIQITRTAGVGTGVQIRGTDANRTEINGVSSVGSGFGRTGISFEDLPAALVSSVEVTKVPDASTIEGSVGGTINLRTIRPLALDDRLIAFSAEAESSDLADTVTPRFSGTIGNKWDNADGQELGVVFSGSYARQDVAFFNPRADRDAVLTSGSGLDSAEDFDYLRIQFFQQNLDNFEYETLNFNGTLEYKPNDDLRFYVDGLYNDQQRTQESYVLDLSGVSAGDVVNLANITSFETIDFGTINGPNGDIQLPTVEAALTGTLLPSVAGPSRLNPNLRVSTVTGARLTESAVFATGLEWDKENFFGTVEISTASSETDSPSFRPRLEFINPNAAQPTQGGDVDNGVPVAFDLSGGTLQFGIADGVASSPSTAMLLDPANYQLGRLTFTEQSADNRESALRLDMGYDTSDKINGLTSVEVGYRYNNNELERNRALSSINYGNDLNRPRASQFSSFVTPGPDNFGDADGRDLFIGNFLGIDPEQSFSNPGAIIAAINAAVATNNADASLGGRRQIPTLGTPSESSTDFFNIEEQTHALYAQANFDLEGALPLRGNAGVRYIDTTVKSTGNTVTQGNVTETVTEESYNFFLPRLNVVADVTEDIVLRGGISRDIRRPNFDTLASSVSFGTGSNTVVNVGNPGLSPESVWSYDLAAEWYFSPASIFSVGVFHKDRTNLFTDIQEDPPTNVVDGVINIDVTAPCEGGGIFNPIADRNINSPIPGVGICVPFRTVANGEGSFTQTGLEVAFQHDLSGWEDRLGWASGFGVIANYTYQKPGGDAQDFASNFRTIGGNRRVFQQLGVAEPLQQIVQPNLSKNAYNATLFYDKFGLNARARYTWRSAFTLPASVESFKVGAPLINARRGQLNASLSYDVNENINIGVEGVNILQGDQEQYCVSENTLLCFNGFTDRRLIAGLNVKF